LYHSLNPPLALVFAVHATCQLAGVRSIDNGALLPIYVVHEVPLELEGIVDVAKAELNVMVLQLVS
jgi:hypothetical protein